MLLFSSFFYFQNYSFELRKILESLQWSCLFYCFLKWSLKCFTLKHFSHFKICTKGKFIFSKWGLTCDRSLETTNIFTNYRILYLFDCSYDLWLKSLMKLSFFLDGIVCMHSYLQLLSKDKILRSNILKFFCLWFLYLTITQNLILKFHSWPNWMLNCLKEWNNDFERYILKSETIARWSHFQSSVVQQYCISDIAIDYDTDQEILHSSWVVYDHHSCCSLVQWSFKRMRVRLT